MPGGGIMPGGKPGGGIGGPPRPSILLLSRWGGCKGYNCQKRWVLAKTAECRGPGSRPGRCTHSTGFLAAMCVSLPVTQTAGV